MIRHLSGFGVFLMVSFWGIAPTQGVSPHRGDGSISLYNLHLDESLEVRYRKKNGTYILKALDQIDKVLRCRMTHQHEKIPVELIELVDEIQEHFDIPQVHIISGYRSPKLNQHLKSIGRKVATRSLHLRGEAMDIRLPGVKTLEVRNYAKSLKKGGVGFYPGNQFVHVDIGRVRYW